MSEQAESIVLALKIVLDALQDIANGTPFPQIVAKKALEQYAETTHNL